MPGLLAKVLEEPGVAGMRYLRRQQVVDAAAQIRDPRGDRLGVRRPAS